MKYQLIILLIGIPLLFGFSCNKSSDGTDNVRYEVITTKGTWDGVYSIKTNGAPIVPDTWIKDQNSGWNLTFTVPNNESEYLELTASPTDAVNVVTAKIYINGKLYCMGISNNDPTGNAHALGVLRGQ